MVVAVEIAEHLRWPGCSAGGSLAVGSDTGSSLVFAAAGHFCWALSRQLCCCPPARKGREWGVQAGQLALVDRAAGEATGEQSGDATAPSLEKSDAQAMVSLAR